MPVLIRRQAWICEHLKAWLWIVTPASKSDFLCSFALVHSLLYIDTAMLWYSATFCRYCLEHLLVCLCSFSHFAGPKLHLKRPDTAAALWQKGANRPEVLGFSFSITDFTLQLGIPNPCITLDHQLIWGDIEIVTVSTGNCCPVQFHQPVNCTFCLVGSAVT